MQTESKYNGNLVQKTYLFMSKDKVCPFLRHSVMHKTQCKSKPIVYRPHVIFHVTIYKIYNDMNVPEVGGFVHWIPAIYTDYVKIKMIKIWSKNSVFYTH